MARYCTMPKLPFGFRAWYNQKFGDLCRQHDFDYAQGYESGGCKLCSDFRFVLGVARRGYPFLALLTLLFVQLPHLWWKWSKKRSTKVKIIGVTGISIALVLASIGIL